MLPKPEDQDKTRALGPEPDAVGAIAAAAVDADALSPGTMAGAYVLKREIASGGGGTVYEAQHKVLGRKAAVKVLRRQLAASPQMVTRFVREAQAVNMIKHPNIVDIYEFDTLPDGRPFYVMELLEGTDVRIAAQRARPLPARRGAGDPRAGLLGAAGRARARHRPPRPQGQQHLHRAPRGENAHASSCSTSASPS